MRVRTEGERGTGPSDPSLEHSPNAHVGSLGDIRGDRGSRLPQRSREPQGNTPLDCGHSATYSQKIPKGELAYCYRCDDWSHRI